MNLTESFKIPKFTNKFSVWVTIDFVVNNAVSNETSLILEVYTNNYSNFADNLVRKLTNKCTIKVNSFMTEGPIIQKPVHRFALQIKGLVFI